MSGTDLAERSTGSAGSLAGLKTGWVLRECRDCHGEEADGQSGEA